MLGESMLLSSSSSWVSVRPTNLKNPKVNEMVEPWLKTPIDFDKVKENSENSVAIFSDNDPYVPLENVEAYRDKLGSKIIVQEEKGHFMKRDGIEEIPAVLEEILKMRK